MGELSMGDYLDRVARSREKLLEKVFRKRTLTSGLRPDLNEQRQKQTLKSAFYYFSNDTDKRKMRAIAMTKDLNHIKHI